MTQSRNVNAPRRTWTGAELATLRSLYPDQPTRTIAALLGIDLALVYRKASTLGLHKSAQFLATDKSGRILKGGALSQLTQFAPGQKPWNAGTHYVAGGRSVETRFKKGQMAGQAQKRWVPVGSYRINGEGILDQKITDWGQGPRDWCGVHRLVWIAANGPIPAGHVVVFKPGRKTTALEQITIDAVECITRRALMQRNSIWSQSPELGRLYQIKGAISRQVNRISQQSAST
jgi:hypothetical protein